jgi:hypothetical protein
MDITVSTPVMVMVIVPESLAEAGKEGVKTRRMAPKMLMIPVFIPATP